MCIIIFYERTILLNLLTVLSTFTDYYDRKNWIGHALKTPDAQAIGKAASQYKQPKSPALNRVNNKDYRFNGKF